MTDRPLTAPASGERLHALDAVRGFALSLGVIFHMTMSFMPGIQVWPVRDVETTPVLSGLFFVLHIFRMATFFLIAGYFGRLLLERRGVRNFVIDRSKRIAGPLVAFWPIVMAAIIGVAIWASLNATGRMPVPPPAPATPQPGAFPLTHLWFLYVLLWFYAGALVFRAVVGRLDGSGRLMAGIDRLIGSVAATPVAALALALPFAITASLTPDWLGWFGITAPDANLIINPVALAAYGTAFGFGWLLHRQTSVMLGWARYWPINLGLAVMLSVGLLAYLGPTPVVTPAAQGWQTAAYALAYGLATWTWTLGLVGFALARLSGHSPVRRYLADASYWIYIAHLPLVMALQTLSAQVAVTWWIKFPILLIAAFAILLASYELLVRHSWLGAWLNGRKVPWRTAALPTQAASSTPEATAQGSP